MTLEQRKQTATNARFGVGQYHGFRYRSAAVVAFASVPNAEFEFTKMHARYWPLNPAIELAGLTAELLRAALPFTSTTSNRRNRP